MEKEGSLNVPEDDIIAFDSAESGTPLSDAALLRRVREGDLEMFEVLWERHHRQLVGYASKRLPVQQAEDAVSDVMEGVLRAILNGKGPERFFRAYVFQSLRHAIRQQRQAGTAVQPSEPEELEWVAPQVPASNPERVMLVQEILASFDEGDRVLLSLNLLEERRVADIAGLLGVSPEQASRRLYDLKDEFRSKWFAAHLDLSGAPEECREVLDRARYAFGRAAKAGKGKSFWAHVDHCAFCAPRVAQARGAADQLVVSFPIAFGAFALAEPGGLVLQALGYGAAAGSSSSLGAVGAAVLSAPIAVTAGVGGAGVLAVVVGAALLAGGFFSPPGGSAPDAVVPTVSSPAASGDTSAVPAVPQTSTPSETSTTVASTDPSASAEPSRTTSPGNAAPSSTASVSAAPAGSSNDPAPAAPHTAQAPATGQTEAPSTNTLRVPCGWAPHVECYSPDAN